MTYLPGFNFGRVNLIKPSFVLGQRRQPQSRRARHTRLRPGRLASHRRQRRRRRQARRGAELYASLQLNEKWFIGLGIGAPFGLMTKYDEGWAGQYHSNKFDIKTINVNPSVAYKVNDKFSMGFGLNWQRIDAEYKEDRGAIARAGPPGLHQWRCRPQFEGRRLGWNVGFMLQPTEDTRIGLSYRSKIRQTAKGDTDIDNIGPTRQSASFDAKATVDLPDTLILSAAHQLNERWELLGDISWTGWSSIPALKIRNSGTGQG